MEDGAQNLAFITDRSIVERKDLYKAPMGLPTKPHRARQLPTYASATLLGGLCI